PDLGWWNSYALGAAVAKMPLPVISGIGHEQDHVVIDEVAHTRAPTPTAAASLLVSKMQAADRILTELRARIPTLVNNLLCGERRTLEAARITVTDIATAEVTRRAAA